VVILGNAEADFSGPFDAVLGLLVKDRPTAPRVDGLPAADEARRTFLALQAGKVDRSRLGEEFSVYLSQERLAGASRRLKPWGKPSRIEVLRTGERGGMEVTVSRLVFKRGNLTALMYRRPNGIIEQFFVDPE
jgi:hypothetical protein